MPGPIGAWVAGLVPLIIDLWSGTRGAAVWALGWWRRRVYNPSAEYAVDTTVAWFEETSKSLLREVIHGAGRLANGFFTLLVSLVDREWGGKGRRGRAGGAEAAGWESWRPSTFNWLIERDHSGGNGRGIEPDQKAGRSGRSNQSQSTWSRFWPSWLWGPKGRRTSAARAQPLRSFASLFDGNHGINFSLRGVRRRGWVEDLQIGSELYISAFFDLIRRAVRWLLMLPPPIAMAAPSPRPDLVRCMSAGRGLSDALSYKSPRTGGPRPHLKRSRSLWGRMDALPETPITAAHVIRNAGYPLQEHKVTTQDGYILHLQRLPQRKSRKAVFFQHGIMDTSLGWVLNGVTGSFAFSAFDQGFDVWLGNSRANPPRRHADPRVERGTKYWGYTLNELGLYDVGSQLEFIHNLKCAELGDAEEELRRWRAEYGMQRQSVDFRLTPRAHGADESEEGRPGGVKRSRRVNSDGQLAALVGEGEGEGGGGPGSSGGVPEGGKGLAGRAPDSARGRVDCGGKSRRVDGLVRRRGKGVTWALEDREGGEPGMGGREAEGKGTACVLASGGGKCWEEGEAAMARWSGPKEMPYTLRAVGHSLGGASLLVHLVMALRSGRSHNLSRLILLSPAGFHHRIPLLAYPFMWSLPPLAWLWTRVLGRPGAAVHIPTQHGRLVIFKALQDALRFPALAAIVNRVIRLILGGDSSPWEAAMQIPHFGVHSMPGISMHTALHLIQLVRTGRFRMYDYGSPDENVRQYGTPEPVDVAAEYGRIDVPVDLVAGTKDGVVPTYNIRMHMQSMLDAGVEVTYKEFDYSHLEFSLTVKEDLMAYVIERLNKDQ
ncbi:unnamed protein product [Ostreobium quekettii]|uniref:Partial AB-hydrolase lipase domain-containing protein n=1 Tax=Ostreobium quekettii TaxID=121088 RepID=A0A8S1IZR9_9CHLO|nr:unnamed protein product [Ostreobium quekettii]